MTKVAVLTSGGLDSAILLADVAKEQQAFPLYVKAGLVWEEQELRMLERFISTLDNPAIQPLTVIPAPVAALYGDHWSLTGDWVPEAATAASNLFLPGRNVLLLSLAALWCSTHGVSRIAIGTLWGNPFPDATQVFFDTFAAVVSKGLAHPIRIEAPFRNLNKEDVIKAHDDLPLDLTLTCMAPREGIHCGDCNKCDERQSAFKQAGVKDMTRYAKIKEQA
ncbi:MAG: 7-cyano-7-deazaguanine synthase [Chloroflexi bacterium]|nr:7-cyano-7-deazaguanine synthase [Chloroflexota bacterium]